MRTACPEHNEPELQHEYNYNGDEDVEEEGQEGGKGGCQQHNYSRKFRRDHHQQCRQHRGFYNHFQRQDRSHQDRLNCAAADAASAGNGMGEHEHEGVSHVRIQVVRKDETRPVDDGSRRAKGRIQSGEELMSETQSERRTY